MRNALNANEKEIAHIRTCGFRHSLIWKSKIKIVRSVYCTCNNKTYSNEYEWYFGLANKCEKEGGGGMKRKESTIYGIESGNKETCICATILKMVYLTL